MFIESIKFSQFEKALNEWRLEKCTLGAINLIVGKNSSGKTMTLNVIGNLGRVMSGEIKAFTSSNYELVEFKKGRGVIRYSLKCEGGKVASENVRVGSTVKLDRGGAGTDKIYFEKEKKRFQFQTPVNEVAVFARRDSIQHPFLEDFYEWGKSVRHYYFGKELGQTSFAVFQKTEDSLYKKTADPKNTQQVVAIVKQGLEEYSGIYEKRIITDMKDIGYDITKIEIVPQRRVAMAGNPPISELWGINVKERDLAGITEQMEMSQGMFRALSLIAQIAYSELTGKSLCILVDDIGEGLDYDRSTALINLLIRRVKKATTQLIMSTNDRFVMNNVPLEYWLIVHRVGNTVSYYNNRNAKKMFDSFKITGLNNFDLFSSEFYLKDYD